MMDMFEVHRLEFVKSCYKSLVLGFFSVYFVVERRFKW